MGQSIKAKKGRLQKIYQLITSPLFFAKKKAPDGKGKSSIETQPEIVKFASKNAYFITIKFHAVVEESISVQRAKNNSIQIKAKLKATEHSAVEEDQHENQYSNLFHMTFDLNENANSSKIEATYKNGLLILRIPKIEKTKQSGLPVKVE